MYSLPEQCSWKRAGFRFAVLLLLATITASAKKPKAPKPSACAASYFCISELDWLHIQDNSIHGFFENRSNATVAHFSITFGLSNKGTITGSAVAFGMVPIPPGGRFEIMAHVFQTFERYDSVIESAKLSLCADLGGKRTCGEESVAFSPPLFGPGAWSEKRAWMKAHGY